ncbi:hypothetical protein [Candidatus Albibeggiatoa sp. nov. BB20]|uniref:hypothetical protein n=1 Tax=Candidatus Albibeggiatoa sp. nov. BB20 TaxID=3162723 RepID=UPI003365B2DE
MSKFPLAIVLSAVLSFPLTSYADESDAAQAAAEEAAKVDVEQAVEEALEPMQKMSFLMGHIEKDAEAEDAALQAAAKAVLEAKTEEEGIPALEAYVNLKSKSVSEEDAAVLRGGYEAMIQMYAEEQAK